MSGDPEQEYFSDGITEDIITELSRFRELHVVARNSSFTFKGEAVDIKEVGRKLGVDYVVEGSVRKAGKRIRVTVQLIDASDGNHIWAERYDRDLDDLFEVQDEISRTIVGALPQRLRGAMVEGTYRKPSQNLSAYDHYLRGRWLMENTATPGQPEVYAWFEKAIAIDPRCAHAFACIGWQLAYSQFNFARSADDLVSRARENLKRALEFGDGDPTIHGMAADAFTCLGDNEVALLQGSRTMALNPNDIQAMFGYGLAMTYGGRPQEAIEFLKRANDLDPQAAGFLLENVAECHYVLGDYQSAADIYLQWNSMPPHGFANLAACHAQLGQNKQMAAAVAAYELASPEDADFASYADAQANMCARPEDAEHWRDGFRKAGFPV
ncbi:MAG: tetratricopeptide repeat protein [Alphaproteobacteria bacterium]|jgi:adenylate cyclase